MYFQDEEDSRLHTKESIFNKLTVDGLYERLRGEEEHLNDKR